MFSNIMTSHFLKTCVIVPKVAGSDIRTVDLNSDDPDYEHKLNLVKKGQAIKHRQNTSLFQRGIMNFEDYNYNLFNKHILVDNEHIFQPDSDSSSKTGAPSASARYKCYDLGQNVLNKTSKRLFDED